MARRRPSPKTKPAAKPKRAAPSKPRGAVPSTRLRAGKPPRGERFACHAARLMDDSRCEEVKVLDLRGISTVADYFVLATGTSDRQIQSVSHEIGLLAVEEGEGKPAFDASPSSGWVVADFFDVVVHLFSPELRAYYDLDSLWADAKRIDWRAVTKPGQFAKLRSQGSGVRGQEK